MNVLNIFMLSVFALRARLKLGGTVYAGIYLLFVCESFILSGDGRTINFSLPSVPDVVHPPMPGKKPSDEYSKV